MLPSLYFSSFVGSLSDLVSVCGYNICVAVNNQPDLIYT